ncbi:MAG: hypothetical protein JSR26_03980 [Proteobacteria bacterium]|nr:hypothetical protein [Pseudomonadota bacterium]
MSLKTLATLVVALCLGACASVSQPTPSGSQAIAATCVTITAAERAFVAAAQAGKVSPANYRRAQA